jgi:hypothetical protein
MGDARPRRPASPERRVAWWAAREPAVEVRKTTPEAAVERRRPGLSVVWLVPLVAGVIAVRLGIVTPCARRGRR